MAGTLSRAGQPGQAVPSGPTPADAPPRTRRKTSVFKHRRAEPGCGSLTLSTGVSLSQGGRDTVKTPSPQLLRHPKPHWGETPGPRFSPRGDPAPTGLRAVSEDICDCCNHRLQLLQCRGGGSGCCSAPTAPGDSPQTTHPTSTVLRGETLRQHTPRSRTSPTLGRGAQHTLHPPSPCRRQDGKSRGPGSRPRLCSWLSPFQSRG